MALQTNSAYDQGLGADMAAVVDPRRFGRRDLPIGFRPALGNIPYPTSTTLGPGQTLSAVRRTAPDVVQRRARHSENKTRRSRFNSEMQIQTWSEAPCLTPHGHSVLRRGSPLCSPDRPLYCLVLAILQMLTIPSGHWAGMTTGQRLKPDWQRLFRLFRELHESYSNKEGANMSRPPMVH